MRDGNTPELLSPAGSPEALEAALSAGADAVYFGSKTMNARRGAENFSDGALLDAVKRCRILGVKANVTVNTQLYGKELAAATELVGALIAAGADAFIVADLGLARAIKSLYPNAKLHASTQSGGQNAYSARTLEKLGFSRMVAPREISKNDLIQLCKTSPIETEIFVHGALCVSFSGQCLMSGVIGGRSGNRGECAQPCRLPYACACKYPLSLKDLSLAAHMTEILPLGIASLKIEGRMKSAEYVYGVTSVYRRLIDERRNADDGEMSRLAELFSRSGFTDGYFTERINSSMLGVRTEKQKAATADIKTEKFPKRTVAVDISGDFSRVPARITASCRRDGEKLEVSVESATLGGDFPPLSEKRLEAALSKIGDTPFSAKTVTVMSGDGGKMPVSALNAARREALSLLAERLARVDAPAQTGKLAEISKKTSVPLKTAYFAFADAITGEVFDYFDRIFVPLCEYFKAPSGEKIGVALPPITFDGECADVIEKIESARAAGCRAALLTSLWQTEAARGMELFGDIRFNVINDFCADALRREGIGYVIASPEARLAGARRCDGAVMYGRLPLMTLQKCAIRDVLAIRGESCRYCDAHKFVTLADRTGAKFVITREPPHRNVIYNSVPVWMCDRGEEFEKYALGAHFIFTDESPARVNMIIDMAKKNKPCEGKFKRI